MFDTVLLFTILWVTVLSDEVVEDINTLSLQWELALKCRRRNTPIDAWRQNLKVKCTAISDIYYPHNVSRTRSTLSGIAEYRSALTLDWMAAEDSRQRELVLAFETEASAPVQVLASDCIDYSKPATGKVARLMLELLKNLEGDNGYLIPGLIQALFRSKLLVETSLLEAEPDLESLIKTPEVMMGEPHATFPKILAMSWMAATDPITVKKNGWCPLHKTAMYLVASRPMNIAKHMRSLDPVIARARFIMEGFIQHVTPNIYDKKNLALVRTTKKETYKADRKKQIITRTSTKVPHSAHLELLKSDIPKYYVTESVNDAMLVENQGVASPNIERATVKALHSTAATPKISTLLWIFMMCRASSAFL